MELLGQDILEEGRLLYSTVKNIANEEITHIFSIYGYPGDHIKTNILLYKLYDRITTDNLQTETIIILGDFNFVQNQIDRNTQTKNRIDVQTTEAWEKIERHCNLQDTYRLLNPDRRAYSFTSRANRGIKSRIDRVYITHNLCGKVLSATYKHTDVSDHKITQVKLASNIEKGPGIYVFNNTLLHEVGYTATIDQTCTEIFSIWSSFDSHRDFWDYFKQNSANAAQQFSRSKNQNERKQINELTKELDNLEEIPHHSLNLYILDKIDTIKSKIKEYQKKKIQGALLRFNTFTADAAMAAKTGPFSVRTRLYPHTLNY